MRKRITDEQAEAAIDTLEAFGREGFVREARDKVSRGTAIGVAIHCFCHLPDCVDAAFQMLDEKNAHLAAAALAAIEKGQGEVKRDGRDLHITLPPWWSSDPAERTPEVMERWAKEHIGEAKHV